jgi:polyhydroxyalkanoate synthase
MSDAAHPADDRPDQPDAAEQLRRFTATLGRAQQLMLEQWASEAPRLATASAPLAQTWLADWTAAMQAMLAEPQRMAEIQARWWAQSLDLWNSFLKGDPVSPVEAEADRDRRFKGELWRSQPVFDLVRQSYLLTARTMLEAAGGAHALDEGTRGRVLFQLRQLLDAMSPANFAALNPEVIDQAVRTGGESILKGLEHMIADLEKGRLTMVDEQAFEIGRNIAATPGRVVFETPLFQLIQYAPTTEQVFEIPLVIFPPWINKFYILDLTPEKSFVRWAVDQGLSVFMVSWRNPGPEFRDATLDTYVIGGLLRALDEVLALTGAPAAHTIGYCVAGTTLATMLGWLAATGGQEKVRSATFFTAQVDFSDPGELKLFIDDAQLQLAQALASDRGYFDGRYMAATFNTLRANDLIWSYVVNNYLLGKEYMAFDLLFWNSDATNVPARWHASYLADFYRDNRLVRGELRVAGVPVNLEAVTVPAYVQAGREDHIAPARSVMKLKDHWGGPLRFVLAGSGHIAGVVNPPSAGKYGYWLLEGAPPDSLEAFEAAATHHKGSWWPDWIAWLAPMSGARVPARVPPEGLEAAPGRYVGETVADVEARLEAAGGPALPPADPPPASAA